MCRVMRRTYDARVLRRQMLPLTRRHFLGAIARFAPAAAALGVIPGCGLLPSTDVRRNRPVRIGLVVASRRADVNLERAAFAARAAELGWREGDTMVIDERFADGQRDAVPAL